MCARDCTDLRDQSSAPFFPARHVGDLLAAPGLCRLHAGNESASDGTLNIDSWPHITV